jgi:hypothetical protein
MKESAILTKMFRRVFLMCQDEYNDDIKSCRIAWEQYDEVRTAIIRRNEKKPPPPKKNPIEPNSLSSREYDI